MDWFATQLLNWFDHHGRHDLPWQKPIEPYRVWISEIMLQQTQVATVIPYFERFVERFPNVESLATAPVDEVLHLWTGLGYYARARNLHKAAVQIVQDFDAVLPQTLEQLESLPGIGRSTAGAIRAIGHAKRAAILDANVKRVLTRFHAISGYPGTTTVANTLWALSESHTPHKRLPDYTQAIMDLGATLCVRKLPVCGACPLHKQCRAFASAMVDQYPEAKPAKIKPERSCRMFVLQNSLGECFLEQRPAEGIWGGLWSPPQRDADYSDLQMLDELNLTSRCPSARQPVFRHTFTHYHLDIEPVFIQIEDGQNRVSSKLKHVWYSKNTNHKLGLSSAAVKLLALAAVE